jgi:hypothetical protein
MNTLSLSNKSIALAEKMQKVLYDLEVYSTVSLKTFFSELTEEDKQTLRGCK